MKLEWISNGQKPKFKLLEPLEIQGFTIPAGFVSDGATAPRIVKPLIDPMGPYAPATFLHDFLLSRFDREFAADQFEKALNNLNIKTWRRVLILAAVRTFDKYKKATDV